MKKGVVVVVTFAVTPRHRATVGVDPERVTRHTLITIRFVRETRNDLSVFRSCRGARRTLMVWLSNASPFA